MFKKVDPSAMVVSKLEAAFQDMKQFSSEHKDEDGLNLVNVIITSNKGFLFLFPQENMPASKTGMPQGEYERADFTIDDKGNILASSETRSARINLEKRFPSVIEAIHSCQSEAKFDINQEVAKGRKLKS